MQAASVQFGSLRQRLQGRVLPFQPERVRQARVIQSFFPHATPQAILTWQDNYQAMARQNSLSLLAGAAAGGFLGLVGALVTASGRYRFGLHLLGTLTHMVNGALFAGVLASVQNYFRRQDMDKTLGTPTPAFFNQRSRLAMCFPFPLAAPFEK